MRRSLSLLSLVALSIIACVGESGDGPGAGLGDTFCGPAMARVDSFMATFAGEEPTGGRYGGMVVVGTVADMHGMSPRAAGDVGSAQHQQFVNLMTLIEADESFDPMPYLATSWEVSEDRTELTFRLREDVYWHDGELTTAQDVAFTYLTVINPASEYPNPGFFQHYLPGEEGVEVVDSFTVKFHFQPHADILESWRGLAILPHHLLGDVPTEELSTHPYGAVCPVGNGPFRFVSRAPGESWTFQANPAFPEALGGRPYLDRYVYRVIPTQTTLLAELITKGVDVYVQMLPNHAATAREETGLTVLSFPYPAIFFVAWNSRVPELSDVRVRRALTLGTNRRQIIEGVQGGEAVLLNSGVPPVHWAFDPSLGDSLPYDPEQARSLLEAAGWVDRDEDGIRENLDGEPLEIELIYNQNRERQQVGEIMRVQLRDIGVELRPRVMEFGAYMSQITSEERDFEGAFVTFETGFRLDDRDLFHSDAVDGLWAFAGIMDPELDRYLDTLQLIPDRVEALPVWRAYQNRLLQLQPYTFLYSALRRDGVNERLQDVVMDPRGDWATIRQWWIAPQDRKTP
jgi:peptide/nickel transport system substrate-binding protein